MLYWLLLLPSVPQSIRMFRSRLPPTFRVTRKQSPNPCLNMRTRAAGNLDFFAAGASFSPPVEGFEEPDFFPPEDSFDMLIYLVLQTAMDHGKRLPGEALRGAGHVRGEGAHTQVGCAGAVELAHRELLLRGDAAWTFEALTDAVAQAERAKVGDYRAAAFEFHFRSLGILRIDWLSCFL